MTRPAREVELVALLLGQGLSQADVARRTGIPRRTVRTWIKNDRKATLVTRPATQAAHSREGCGHVQAVPPQPYSYLLGLYLGDGCLSAHPRGVYRLRITLDQRYTSIIAACAAAMAEVLPNKIGVTQRIGCVEVSSYSKHWPCLFPQHAPGRKHLRSIVLLPWQETIALETHPRLFIRGLIHSDGYCGMNLILGGRYAYPRYLFSNRSDDIKALFVEACRRVGIEARPSNPWTISVAPRCDVALMDTFVGPKT